MSNLYRGPSKDASFQFSIHLAKWFQGRIFFRNQPIRIKNCLWRPCLITDWDEMSNLYRGHAIDANSYQVSVHLAKRFQRRRFLINSCAKSARYARDRAGLRQCRHLRFLISFGDKIPPLAIFLATTFSFSKIIWIQLKVIKWSFAGTGKLLLHD